MKHNQDHNERYKHFRKLINDRNRRNVKQNLLMHFSYLIEQSNSINSSIRKQYTTSKGSLVPSVIDSIDEINQKLTEFADGLGQTFTLFVVGMGNYGKSTLINALLEQNAAPMDFRPKTWKIDVYDSNLPEDQCLIIYRNGKREYKTVEETTEFISKEEHEASESKKKVRGELEKIVGSLKTKEEVIETKQYLEKQYLYQSDVIEVRWPIEKRRLTEHFHLVDTPGLMQENLSGETMVSIQKYYPKADGVIWILDATKIASKKSKEMMDELEKSLEKVGGKTDNIIAVLNRIDLVRKNGGETAVSSVLEDAHRIFGKYFSNFVSLSAKEAYDGVMKGEEELISRSGIKDLHSAIREHFYENARRIQLESKLTGFMQVLQQLREEDHVIQSYYKRLLEEQDLYSKRHDKIKKEFSTSSKKFANELEEAIKKFTEEAYARIDGYAETLFDLESESERSAYIRDQLFCFDLLQPELERFSGYWTKELEETTKRLQYESQFSEYQYIDPLNIDRAVKSLDKANSSRLIFSVDAGTVNTENISLASGAGIATIGAILLGPIGLALGGITAVLGINKGIAKFFKGGKLKQQLKETVEKNVKDIKKSVLKQMKNLAREGESNSFDVLNDSFASLHGSLQTSIEVKELIEQLFAELSKEIVYPDFKLLLVEDYNQDKFKKEVG